MRSLFIRSIVIGALAALPACSADIHDNTVTIPNARVNVTSGADLSNVQTGQPVPLHIDVSGVFLVPPGTTPPPDHKDDAGHLAIFIDSTSSASILVTAQVDFSVTVPAATPKGKHKFICRVDKDDGTPTTTTFELSFTVTVSTGGADAGTVDAGIVDAAMPVDAADGSSI